MLVSHSNVADARPHHLVAGDYSQIEARMLAWLAGQQSTLDAFVAGIDLYVSEASKIFGFPIDPSDKAKRLIGKVAVLACGFQGALGAFKAFAKLYKLNIPDEMALDIVRKWRDANLAVTEFWKNLELAAMLAVRNPGVRCDVKNTPIWFRSGPNVLAMALPSGRPLVYWYPHIGQVTTPWGEKTGLTYWAEDAQKKVWTSHTAYGGLLAENATQAASRDVLAGAMLRIEDDNLCPILSVHDEIVCQIPKSRYPSRPEAEAAVRDHMVVIPKWCPGIPLAADVHARSRYMKG